MDFWLNSFKNKQVLLENGNNKYYKNRESCSSIVQCLTTAMFNEIQKQTDENVSEVNG